MLLLATLVYFFKCRVETETFCRKGNPEVKTHNFFFTSVFVQTPINLSNHISQRREFCVFSLVVDLTSLLHNSVLGQVVSDLAQCFLVDNTHLLEN